MRRALTPRSSLVLKSLVSLAILPSILLPCHAQAQVKSVSAAIPFTFQTGHDELPAGSYRITPKSMHLLLIQSQDLKHSAYVMVQPELRGRSTMPGKLVFYRVGGRLFLKEIWAPEQPQGSKVLKSDLERGLLVASLFRPSADAQLAVLSVPLY